MVLIYVIVIKLAEHCWTSVLLTEFTVLFCYHIMLVDGDIMVLNQNGSLCGKQ